MKINHKLIREVLKWCTFLLFVISVSIKLKAILKYGGTTPNKDPNEDIHLEEDGPMIVESEDDNKYSYNEDEDEEVYEPLKSEQE